MQVFKIRLISENDNIKPIKQTNCDKNIRILPIYVLLRGKGYIILDVNFLPIL